MSADILLVPGAEARVRKAVSDLDFDRSSYIFAEKNDLAPLDEYLADEGIYLSEEPPTSSIAYWLGMAGDVAILGVSLWLMASIALSLTEYVWSKL